eukprot:410104-Rhodomonas_salina.1
MEGGNHGRRERRERRESVSEEHVAEAQFRNTLRELVSLFPAPRYREETRHKGRLKSRGNVLSSTAVT